MAAAGVAGLFSERVARSTLSRVVDKILPRANPPERGTREWLDFINKNPLLRLAVGRITDGMASVRFRVQAPARQGVVKEVQSLKYLSSYERWEGLQDLASQGELVDVPNHPLCDIQGQNLGWFLDGMSLRKLTYAHIETVGDGFWMLGRNAAGVPVSALSIPPSWVLDTPTMNRPSFRLQEKILQEEIPAKDMVWFRDHNPADPYGRGRGAAQALGAELESMEHASSMIRRFFYNDARPNLLVTGSNFEDKERKALENRWHQKLRGFQRSYMPFFMKAPENMQIKEIQTGFRDLQMVELMEWEISFIRRFWGIPPSIIGDFKDNSGLGRSGVELEEAVFARWVLVPRLEHHRAVFQDLMDREWDDRLIVTYDNPVKDDRDFQLEAMKAQPAAYSVDEWRGVGGHPEREEEDQGRAHLVPVGIEIRPDLAPDDLDAEPAPREPEE